MRRVVAWGLWGIAVAAGGVAALALALLNRGARIGGDPWGFPGSSLVFALTFTNVGLLVALRQPRNPIGWTLLACGVISAIQELATQYATYGLVTAPGSLPAPAVAGWLLSWIFVIPVGLTAVAVPLLFPDGRLSSRGDVVVLALLVPAALALIAGFAFIQGPLENMPAAVNPFGIVTRETAGRAVGAGFIAILLVTALAVRSQVRRFRSSAGVERQQVKWFAYAAALLGVALLGQTVFAVPVAISGADTTAYAISTPLWMVAKLLEFVLIAALAFIPVSVGIAITRFGLYEIDVLIKRTLVYGVLSALLAVTYVSLVVLLQAILRPLTGGSEIAVAASTLGTVAVVQPFRRRVQEAVDRRFFRSRYDAARTLDAFSSRLRDEVDLDALRGDLLAVLGDTVRPSHAALWLRQSGQ